MNRLWRLEHFGPSFRDTAALVEEPVGEPGPGEVLVRHAFIGVNGLFDESVARGELPYRDLRPPQDLGVEAVGTVECAGPDVTGLTPGMPVATSRFGTGYREWAVLPARDAVPVPAATPEYVALRTSAVSALLALTRPGEMSTGETVLITAAAGGLGQFLVQLARLAGNHVIGVCSGPTRVALLRELGCQRPVDRIAENLADVLGREYPGGVDLAVDTVGGEVFDAILDNLAPRGRLVVAGYATDQGPGRPVSVTRPRDYTRLYWKAASIRAFQNAFYVPAHRPALTRLLHLYAEGRLSVRVDPTAFRGIAAVPDAIDHLTAGRSVGKVVVDVRPMSDLGSESSLSGNAVARRRQRRATA
jgi:NADPH:quinone reductase-like Zn-dependent oxidoreductase